jgi:hypothetical protein
VTKNTKGKAPAEALDITEESAQSLFDAAENAGGNLKARSVEYKALADALAEHARSVLPPTGEERGSNLARLETRLSPTQRRQLQSLARAGKVSRSEAMRRLITDGYRQLSAALFGDGADDDQLLAMLEALEETLSELKR